jgi:dephospho-CoA kinase
VITVGLTGGIATGKSTVASVMARFGATVLDADHVVRELQRPGTTVYQAILQAFGPSILQSDGTINRKRLGEMVFQDEGARRRLEATIHPALVAAIEERLRAFESQGVKLCVVELPLLIEAGAQGRFDWVVVVTAPEEVQVSRLMADRGLTREEALARIRSQMPLQEKVAAADFVVENVGDLQEIERRVQELYRTLLQKGSKKA